MGREQNTYTCSLYDVQQGFTEAGRGDVGGAV